MNFFTISGTYPLLIVAKPLQALKAETYKPYIHCMVRWYPRVAEDIQENFDKRDNL
jgi:hypothetical protein